MQAIQGLKTCSRCREPKPLECFHASPASSDGRATYCKPCASELNREYRQRNAEYLTARHKEVRSQRIAADPDYSARSNLRFFYGLTLDDYERKLIAQGGGCAVCGNPPGAKRLAVDHDRTCCPGNRSCGRCVRGLLCNGCNNGTGLKDDPALLLRRADYVEQWRAWHIGRLFG